MSPLKIGGGVDILHMTLAVPVSELKIIDKLNEDPVKYGLLGFTLAHEMSHFFDKDGWFRFSNKHNMREQKMKCIERQYNNTITTDDDFADISGVEIAYRALENKLGKKTMKRPVAKGHNFTNEQVFFISFAHHWCKKKEELGKEIGNTHSPGDLRTLNPLRNSDAFAKAFHCPAGSPMNPFKKCRIWTKPDHDIILWLL